MDLIFAGLLVVMSALWAWAGVQLCTQRHQQRGIDVDDWGTTFPDTPPAAWVDEFNRRKEHV